MDLQRYKFYYSYDVACNMARALPQARLDDGRTASYARAVREDVESSPAAREKYLGAGVIAQEEQSKAVALLSNWK